MTESPERKTTLKFCFEKQVVTTWPFSMFHMLKRWNTFTIKLLQFCNKFT